MKFTIEIDDTLIGRLREAFSRLNTVTRQRGPATDEQLLEVLEGVFMTQLVNHEVTTAAETKRALVSLEVESKKKPKTANLH